MGVNSSELILNNDGSVYHLGLKPGDVSTEIITVGDPNRVARVSDHFDTVDFRAENREFVTHTGKIGGKRLTVISTGIGTDNVDIVFNELHILKTLEGNDQAYTFVRLGTSGTVRADVALDSLLMSSAAIGMDGLLQFYEWDAYQKEVDNFVAQSEKWKLMPRPYAAFADNALLNQFMPIVDGQGVTFTAPGFYGPQGRSVNVPARISKLAELLSTSTFAGMPITNIEMETAGIYGMSSLLGHKAVSISAILANRINGDFSENPEKVIDSMIKKALEVITS